MVDFHCHILPQMDDGADSVETSLAMLDLSTSQGVDIVFATPHFYADQTDPSTFLAERSEAFSALQKAVSASRLHLPEVIPGAEILYYPGMSYTEELSKLKIEGTPFLLIEPPVMPWSDSVIDEIEQTGQNLRLIPVIAHIDRYMNLLHDNSLIDRLEGRKLLIQVNASYFLRRESSRRALNDLSLGRFHFIGSDAHNLSDRSPNIGEALDVIRSNGLVRSFAEINYRIYSVLGRL